uniref:Uncharacterized protein n=1 Tax=Anguilla anguilla TaxID=7936 RepID=A0A0E9XPV0_ANGAN
MHTRGQVNLHDSVGGLCVYLILRRLKFCAGNDSRRHEHWIYGVNVWSIHLNFKVKVAVFIELCCAVEHGLHMGN